MDHLPLAPTPPAQPLLALPAVAAGAQNGAGPGAPPPPPASRASLVARILTVMGNLLLLPLRLLRRLVIDLAAMLGHLWRAMRDAAVAVVVAAALVVMVAAESFGENFFLGEVFQALFPNMREYAADIPVGALATLVLPWLDELRAAAILSFVIAWASVLAMGLFFTGLLQFIEARAISAPAVQEALILDPMAQEHVTPNATPRTNPVAVVKMVIGGVTEVLILGFELYAFDVVVDYGWLGPLAALLLLAARVVVGYVAHALVGFAGAHAWSALQSAELFVATMLAVVTNLVEETLTRLRNLASD